MYSNITPEYFLTSFRGEENLELLHFDMYYVPLTHNESVFLEASLAMETPVLSML